MQFLRDFLLIYCTYALWSALFTHGMGYAGATRLQVLIYGVYGAVVTVFVTREGCQTYIAQRIRTGTVDGDIVKPMNLHGYMLMRDLAQKFSKFVLFTLPTLVIFSLVVRLFFVPHLLNFGMFLVSALLAYGVLFSINFLFGMLCFYTLSIENISFCYTAVISFLAGQMVPLWLFPDWAQRIVNILPFRYIFDVPMSIYIGRLSRSQALETLGIQLFWVVTLTILCRLVWHGIRKNVISQGG